MDIEFFINKAIGWSLRDYSKTNPDWVRAFLKSTVPKWQAYPFVKLVNISRRAVMAKVYEFEAVIHPVPDKGGAYIIFPMIYEKSLARGG